MFTVQFHIIYISLYITTLRRSAPNRRKRDCTKETPKLAALRRSMTNPNLRCQVVNVIVAALPPIPHGTCISDIATNMADVMLFTAAEMVPHFKRPRGAQGWCTEPDVEADMNAAWQQRGEARRHLCAEAHDSNFRKFVMMIRKKLWKVGKAAMLSFFWDFARKLETRTREGDQAGFYKHLKTMNLEGKRVRSSTYVIDENRVLLRDVELIRERWVRWFYTLLNAKSPRLDPTIAEGLDKWPKNMPLEVQPTMQKLTDSIRSLVNGKAVGPDGVSFKLFKITLNGDPTLRWNCSMSSFVFGGGAKCHSSGKIQSAWYSMKRRIGDRVRHLQGYLAGSARRQDTAEDHRSPPQRVLRPCEDPAGGTKWFPTKQFYHRYDVCDSSATGAGAEETISAVYMLYRRYHCVRLR